MLVRRFFISLLLSCATPAFGAAIDMHHMNWTAREGAPQMVLTMTQTRDGWLWLGSNNGLFRFDGVRFERYAAPGGKLAATAIATLNAFDDALWIGYRYGGVSVLSGGALRHYNQHDGLPASAGVWGLERDGAGRMWAATTQGLFRLDGARWIAAGDAPATFFKTLIRDRAGNLWAQGNDGVYRLPAGVDAFAKAAPDSGTGVVFQAPDGNVWSWNAPRAVLRRLTTTAAAPRSWDIGGNVASLLVDSRGDAWVGRMNGLDYHTRRAVQHSGTEQGLSGAWVTAMFEDREGNVWVSTATGIDRFRSKRITTVPLAVVANVNPLATDADDGVWVGRFHYTPSAGGGHTIQPAWQGDPAGWHTDPYTIYRDPAGVMWMTTFRTLWRKQGARLQRLALPDGDGVIASMSSDDSGRLWVAMLSKGLYRLEPDGAWTSMSAATGLPDDTPSIMAGAPQRGLWLGYARSRLLHLQQGRWRSFGPDQGLNLGMLQAVHLKAEHVWAGGESGVALLQGGRFLPFCGAGGISFEGVTGIVELDNGDVWLNAVNGLFRVDAAEIARFQRDSGYRVHYERFDSLDGLAGNAPSRMPLPSMVQAADGQLWLSTTVGVFRLDPSLRPRTAPAAPVRILAIGQPGQLQTARDGLRLAQGSTAVQIDYTALALAMPERVAFRYRLEGVDRDWQLAGTRRTANYNNLGPGDFRFSVQATDYLGGWSGQQTTLAFGIEPSLTQSRWFKALCVALLLGACWLLYRWRLRTFAAGVAARLQERTSERERIARELHDTVLQSVQGMILHVHAAALELPAREPARIKIEQALQQADDALLEGRDRVRDLRSEEPDEQDLAAAIANAGNRLRMPDAPPLQLQVSGPPRALHPLVYEELLAIATEAIANAYRHTSAGSIHVQLHYDARELRLNIRDDGAGIPAEVLAAGGRSNHWGIRGMLERAEKIKARLKLHSAAGAGTEWRLTLAYQYAVCV
nr:two-component regulator propeller domain-containing protein [uncultured Duganella sp.]